MTIFKPKTKKTISYCNKKTTTLDAKHKEYINEFKLNDIDIQKLSEKKKRLIKKLKSANSKDIEKTAVNNSKQLVLNNKL